MTVYYIDYNRGNDANAGTSVSAKWQNLSKLSGVTLAAGDEVVFDDESTWNVTDRVVIGTINGAFYDSAVTFRRSYTNGTQKPTISFKFSVTAGQWTYDAPNNGWYYDLGYTPGVMTWIRLGGNRYAQKQVDALPLVSTDYTWRESSNRVYLYAPSGQDPTTYYGSVEIGPSDRGAITFSSDGSNVLIDGLRSEESGTAILIYANSGTRRYVLRNCESFDTSTFLFATPDTAGDVRITVEDGVFDTGVSAFIQFYNVGGAGLGPCLVRRNKFSRANLGFPQGAVYDQNRKGTLVIDNDFSDCSFGNAFQTSDGCGLYAEVGSNNFRAIGNRFRRCHLAMQDNSGRKTEWHGNIAIECYGLMKVGDQSAVGATNHGFYGNTGIRMGYPVPTLGGTAVPTIGWRMIDVGSDLFKLYNNLLTRYEDASSNDPAFETPVSAAGGSAVVNNLAYGFSAVAAAYDGSSASPTPSGSLTSNPLLDDNYKPRVGSPCLNGGSKVSGVRLYDHFGKEIDRVPDIGAMQVYEARSTASVRSVATARSAANDREQPLRRAVI